MAGMSDWHPDCYQRATAYVTDPNGRLLVFDHLDSVAQIVEMIRQKKGAA